MGLEIVRGNIKKPSAIRSLVATLEALSIEGTLYAGYPIIASADSSHTIEALLVSPIFGLIAFNFPQPSESVSEIQDKQDQIFYLLEGNLKKHETLRKGRKLGVSPNIISFYIEDSAIPTDIPADYHFAGPKTIKGVFEKCDRIDSNYFRPLCAAIQRVTTIKPIKKRENVQKVNSKGAIIKQIEKEIANLDQWQKKAAIEVPDAPQRIRGLAGSGKTIVLALKAAYIYAQHPDWNIVVTFHTRSLSQQFRDLIERFCLEHLGDKPNWEKLQILHSWGSASEPGVYSNIAEAFNIVPVDYSTAKNKYGVRKAFEGICNELLEYVPKGINHELFDCILIDEAQDLPISFFKLVYAATKNPKRIIFAYDELQNLNNTIMPPVKELFGTDKNKNPLVSVCNIENEPQQDIILPVCYRNTPWALTLAHALGFGIYREEGLVQLFDELPIWQDIGYIVESGKLDFDKTVTLKRRDGSFPSYYKDLLNSDDAIISKQFENDIEQYEWVADQIHNNISEDELDPDDILVIFPNAYTSRREYPVLAQSLAKRGINCHLAGVSTDRDVFTQTNSATIASIYRAKGNEAPMVYVIHSDWCAAGNEMIKLRNILFAAITRSKGWVRICGVGDNMKILKSEISKVREHDFKLSFKIPTKEELKSIRLINRDRTQEEKGKISKAIKSLEEIDKLFEAGVWNPSDPELKRVINLAKKINKKDRDLDAE